MHGNVWQWCADLFDPKQGEGSGRAGRGGGWGNDGTSCQAALRNGYVPTFRCRDLGFRLARVPVR
jgi:formylglycine-generating enzyme required for sulfatase activity